MKVFYPPYAVKSVDKTAFSIFLAGTIDLGNSENWQEKVCKLLNNHNVTVYNPRRHDWDNSIVQSIKDQRFAEQVNWELDHLELSDLIVMYLAPNSKSPISLMELGMFAKKKMVVFCAENFYRRGNVEVVCQRYNIPLYDNEEIFLKKLVASLSFYEKEN